MQDENQKPKRKTVVIDSEMAENIRFALGVAEHESLLDLSTDTNQRILEMIENL